MQKEFTLKTITGGMNFEENLNKKFLLGLLVVVVFLLFFLELTGIWKVSSLWSDSERFGGVYDRRHGLNRMAVTDDRPGHHYNGLEKRNERMTTPSLRKFASEKSRFANKTLKNLSGMASSQRERMTGMNSIDDIFKGDTGNCNGHQPETSDGEMFAKIGL